MKYALLIPCYEPGEDLSALAEEIKKTLSADLYLVNDGSGPSYDHIFQKLASSGCTVISYEKNQGKGAALRTGFREILNSGKPYAYVLTADADGQHTPEDIRKIADAAEEAFRKSEENRTKKPLILGIRQLSGKNVPAKSKFGNRFSSLYFRFITGVRLSDTQTGLRAVPDDLLEQALNTPGDRYDYEMNFLISAADRIRTVPVRTVYKEGNSTSHFHAFRDSVLIYRTPLRYLAVSLVSAAVDLTLFAVLSAMCGTLFYGILTATAAARTASGIVNFSLNRKWAFASVRAEDGNAGSQALRYLILFVSQMLASSLLVTLFAFLPLPLTAVKMVIDTFLAFFSYFMQHNWVFRQGRPKDDPHTECGSAVP